MANRLYDFLYQPLPMNATSPKTLTTLMTVERNSCSLCHLKFDNFNSKAHLGCLNRFIVLYTNKFKASI